MDALMAGAGRRPAVMGHGWPAVGSWCATTACGAPVGAPQRRGSPATVSAVGPAPTKTAGADDALLPSAFAFAHGGKYCHRLQPGATLNAALEAAKP